MPDAQSSQPLVPINEQKQTHLVVLGVPEDDTVLQSVWLGEGIHHGVGEIAPLEQCGKITTDNSGLFDTTYNTPLMNDTVFYA